MGILTALGIGSLARRGGGPWSQMGPRDRWRMAGMTPEQRTAYAASLNAPTPTGQAPPVPAPTGNIFERTQAAATKLQATVDAQKQKAGADKAIADVAATKPPNAIADLSSAASQAAAARMKARRRALSGNQRVGSIAPPQRGIGYQTNPRTLLGG